MADGHPIISRKEAQTLGLKRYFTGRPCKRGHVSERQVADCGCCECVFLRLKEWRADNPERWRRQERAWRKKNSKRLKTASRARYAKNPAYFIEHKKRHYKANAEKIRAQRRAQHKIEYLNEAVRLRAQKRTRQWAQDNPERALANAKVAKHRRRARTHGAKGSFSAADVREILKRQRGKCAHCRIRLGTNKHLDHIVPLARGGSNHRSNLQFLCAPCNLAKGARDPIDHAQSLGLLL